MSLADIRWFAENAQRQRVGPLHVYHMAAGAYWYLADRWQYPISVNELLELARLVEPDHNRGRFRNVNVQVGSHHAPDWREVPRLIDQLIAATSLSADEWYREYELIHPLRDGNGRTGAILWNGHRWRNGVGEVGVWEHPPDFFNREWFTKGVGSDG